MRLEIEVFDDIIYFAVAFVEFILKRIFSNIYKREGYQIEIELYKGAPKAKCYKRDSLILKIKVIKK